MKSRAGTHTDFSCIAQVFFLYGLYQISVHTGAYAVSPSVDLSPTTFTRLQTHAVPLIDTIENVINRLLDAYEAKSGTPIAPADGDNDITARQFNPNTPPSLTHAKVLAIEFGGKPLARGDATGTACSTRRFAKPAPKPNRPRNSRS
jgi:hypothetical protein